MKDKYFLKPFELFFIVLNISTYKIFTAYSSFLPQNSGSSAPISALLSGLLVFGIIITLISLCEKNKCENIFSLMPKNLKIPAFLLFFIYLIFSSASTLRFTGELIKAISFPTAPLIYLLLIIISATVLCCAQGFDAISRLHSIILPLFTVLILPILISSSKYGNISNLFPVFGYGIPQTLSTALFSIGLYGDTLILFMLFPFCNRETHFKRTALLALGTGVVINTLVIGFFTLATPYTVTDTISHPFLQLVKLFSAGKFLQRIDGYFMYAVSGCGILALALNFFVISYSAKQVFSLPKIRPLSYSLGLICLFLSVVILNRETALNLSFSGLFILYILVLSVVILSLLYAILKRRKNT